MAQTAEEIEAELVTLRAAAAEGVLSVHHSDGRSTTYQSLREIELAIKRREQALTRLTTGRRRRIARLYQSGSGM